MINYVFNAEIVHLKSQPTSTLPPTVDKIILPPLAEILNDSSHRGPVAVSISTTV